MRAKIEQDRTHRPTHTIPTTRQPSARGAKARRCKAAAFSPSLSSAPLPPAADPSDHRDGTIASSCAPDPAPPSGSFPSSSRNQPSPGGPGDGAASWRSCSPRPTREPAPSRGSRTDSSSTTSRRAACAKHARTRQRPLTGLGLRLPPESTLPAGEFTAWPAAPWRVPTVRGQGGKLPLVQQRGRAERIVTETWQSTPCLSFPVEVTQIRPTAPGAAVKPFVPACCSASMLGEDPGRLKPPEAPRPASTQPQHLPPEEEELFNPCCLRRRVFFPFQPPWLGATPCCAFSLAPH